MTVRLKINLVDCLFMPTEIFCKEITFWFAKNRRNYKKKNEMLLRLQM